MDFSNFNWMLVGFPIMGVCLVAFIVAAKKRQWTLGSLLIGMVHQPLSFMHAAAPFRGSLDPNYPGYGAGLIRADPGFEVLVFSGFVLIGATVCARIGALNKSGKDVGFLVMFDSTVLLLLGVPIIGDFFAGNFANSRVEFGEYLQFGGTAAFLFEFTLIAVPYILGLFWGMTRFKTTS